MEADGHLRPSFPKYIQSSSRKTSVQDHHRTTFSIHPEPADFSGAGSVAPSNVAEHPSTISSKPSAKSSFQSRGSTQKRVWNDDDRMKMKQKQVSLHWISHHQLESKAPPRRHLRQPSNRRHWTNADEKSPEWKTTTNIHSIFVFVVFPKRFAICRRYG